MLFYFYFMCCVQRGRNQIHAKIAVQAAETKFLKLTLFMSDDEEKLLLCVALQGEE
jgi:hypothetical protein